MTFPPVRFTMRLRPTLAVLAVLFWVSSSCAQDTKSAADAPASKEDIQRYLEVTHSRETMKNIMEVMSKSARQLAPDEYAKNRQSMPADAEERLNRRSDENKLPVQASAPRR